MFQFKITDNIPTKSLLPKELQLSLPETLPMDPLTESDIPWFRVSTLALLFLHSSSLHSQP